MYQFEKVDLDDCLTPTNYYVPTIHFADRYKERMGENTTRSKLRNMIHASSDYDLGIRANYMLLFSIFGRSGETPETEIRFYFDWDIVVDNKNKRIITMYQNEVRAKLPAHLFGNPKIRRKIYKYWFTNNEM